MDLAIYGAQGMALGAYEAIHNQYPSRNIRCFLVTKRGNNAEYLSGVPVFELESFSRTLSVKEKAEIEVLIAAPENVMEPIEKSLDEQGLFCHARLTSSRWSELMGYHYISNKKYIPLHALAPGYHKAGIQAFLAKFYRDKPLSGQYDFPEWITPIQVGAALCTERVAGTLDCTGENISEKNVNYSELTALYWIWKNCLTESHDYTYRKSKCSEYERRECCRAGCSDQEYYGLMHYRRILDITEDDLFRLVNNDQDVVLPYPMPYEPNIEKHHERYLKKEDWDAVWKAVMERQPGYADAFHEILKQRFLYNYNIIVARKNVLADYCGWLFPILERVEELSVPRGSERADRYIGYIGETLETLYFMHNRDRLNISHAGCIFLS